MVCLKEMFLLVVVFNCVLFCVPVEGKRIDRHEALQNDGYGGSGVQIDIDREEDKKRIDKGCLDCDTSSQDIISDYSLPSRHRQKRKEQNVNKRKKKKSQKKSSASDGPSEATSLSDYFSRYWKDKPSEDILEKKIHDARVDTIDKELEPMDSKPDSKSLLNYFSSNWLDKKTETENFPSGPEVSKKSRKNKNENKDTKKKKQGKKEKSDGSLFSHFSSFWDNEKLVKEGNSDNDSTQLSSGVKKEADIKGKNKKKLKKKKKEKRPRSEKNMTEEHSSHRKMNKDVKNDTDNSKKGKVDDKQEPSLHDIHTKATDAEFKTSKLRKSDKTSEVENIDIVDSNSVDQSLNNSKLMKTKKKNVKSEKRKKQRKNKKEKKKRRNFKAQTIEKEIIDSDENVVGTNTETNDDDNRSNKFNENIDSYKVIKILKEKEQKETFRKEEKSIYPDTSVFAASADGYTIENEDNGIECEEKSDAKKEIIHTEEKQKSQDTLVNCSVDEKKADDVAKSTTPKQLEGKLNKHEVEEESESESEEEGEISNPNLIDFQGLKSKVNSVHTDSLDEIETNESGSQTNDYNNRSVTKSKKEIDVSKFNPQNVAPEMHESNRTAINRAEKKPKGPLAPTLKNNIKKQNKNRSKKENIFEMLASAESAFKKKDRRIRRRLSALNDKTKKRFDDFNSLRETSFNDRTVSKVTFNLTRQNQQLEESKMNLTELNRMMLNLKEEVIEETPYDKMSLDEPYKSVIYGKPLRNSSIWQGITAENREQKSSRPRKKGIINQHGNKGYKSKSGKKERKRKRRRNKKEKERIRKENLRTLTNVDSDGLGGKNEMNKKERPGKKSKENEMQGEKLPVNSLLHHFYSLWEEEDSQNIKKEPSKDVMTTHTKDLSSSEGNGELDSNTKRQNNDDFESIHGKVSDNIKGFNDNLKSPRKHLKNKKEHKKSKDKKHKMSKLKRKRMKGKKEKYRKKSPKKYGSLVADLSSRAEGGLAQLNLDSEFVKDQKELTDRMMSDGSDLLVTRKNRKRGNNNNRKFKNGKRKKMYKKDLSYSAASQRNFYSPHQDTKSDRLSKSYQSQKYNQRKHLSNAMKLSDEIMIDTDSQSRDHQVKIQDTRKLISNQRKARMRFPLESRSYHRRKVMRSRFRHDIRDQLKRNRRRKSRPVYYTKKTGRPRRLSGKMRDPFKRDRYLKNKNKNLKSAYSTKRLVSNKKKGDTDLLVRKSRLREDKQEGLKHEDNGSFELKSKSNNNKDNHNDDPNLSNSLSKGDDDDFFIVKRIHLKKYIISNKEYPFDARRMQNSRRRGENEDFEKEDDYYIYPLEEHEYNYPRTRDHYDTDRRGYDREDRYPYYGQLNPRPYRPIYYPAGRRRGSLRYNSGVSYHPRYEDYDYYDEGYDLRQYPQPSYEGESRRPYKRRRRRRHRHQPHSRYYDEDEDWDSDSDYLEGRWEPGRGYDRGQGRKPINVNQGRDRYSFSNGGGDSYHGRRDNGRKPDNSGYVGNRLTAREYQRRQKIQRLSPVVSEKSQQIQHRLKGVVLHYSDALSKSESIYKDIFNGTRYDIMNGLRDVYEELQTVNENIYDAVLGLSDTTRSIFMKAHKQREARNKGLNKDEPPVDIKATALMIKDRNFRKTLYNAQMEQRRLLLESKHLRKLKLRHNQVLARLQQVKEHLKKRYDRQALTNIFNNMRSTVDNINEGLAATYGLAPFKKDKSYVTHVKQEIASARDAIKFSKTAVENGMRKMLENKGLFRKLERENQGRRRRVKRKRSGTRVNAMQLRRMKDLITKGKHHSVGLIRTAVFVQRSLLRPIQNGKAALQSRLSPYIDHLGKDVKEMFSTLDNLKVYIESEPRRKFRKSCKDDIVEGSADDGTTIFDEEDFDCMNEGSNSRVTVRPNGGEDDSFEFENDDNIEPSASGNGNPIKSFGVKINEFSSHLLSLSEGMNESSQNMLRLTGGLKTRLEAERAEFLRVETRLTLRRNIQSKLEGLKNGTKAQTSRLQKIMAKLDGLKGIDFDVLESKAFEVIKSRENSNGRLPVSKKEKENINGEDFEETGKKDEEEDKEEEKRKEVKTEENQKKNLTDTTVDKDEDSFDYRGLFRTGKYIGSNIDDFKFLQNLAINTYGKSCDKMNNIHNNISSLLQKVKKARNLLTSFQLSVSKTGDSPIPAPIPADRADPSNSLITTMSISIKPSTLDGTVFYAQGNQSASYTLSLSDGELTTTVYGADNNDMQSVTLDSELQENKWYSIRIIRFGQMLNVTMKGEEEDVHHGSVQVNEMQLLQPSLINSFIGGVPDESEISGNPWQGCVGQFLVDEKSISRFQPALNGKQVSLCSDHCISQEDNVFWSFDGDGFVHYLRKSQDTVDSVSIEFRTWQSTGSILSIVDRRRQLNLIVGLDKGAVKVETSYHEENAVLLSSNTSLNDGQVHQLKIQYIQRKSYAELDGDKSAFSVQQIRPQMYRYMKNGVLIGSFVSENGQYLNDRYRPLSGCIGKLVINENPVIYNDAAAVYNSQYGGCKEESMWQSCAHFTENSVPVSLGSLENSNKVSVLVERNATGPVMLFSKKEKFISSIILTEDGVKIIGKISSDTYDAELLKTKDETLGDDAFFTLLTIEDDGDRVAVKAYGQSASIKYTSWFHTADTKSPHTITVGKPLEDEGLPFKGSLSQLVIGNRVHDLMMYIAPNQLEICKKALKPIVQSAIQEENNFCS